MRRKEFLKYACKTTVSIAGLGLGIREGNNAIYNSVEKGELSPVLGLHMEPALRATATAVAKTGAKTTFVPEGVYTEKFIEHVRRGTFIIGVTTQSTDKSSGEKITERGSATAWLAEQKNGELYFVTNRHVIDNVFYHKLIGDLSTENSSVQINGFYRPYIDTDMYEPDGADFLVEETDKDMAVIKCKGNYESETPLEILPWVDHYTVKTGEKMVVAGFPGALYSQSDRNHMLSGSVNEVISVNKDDWAINGIVHKGGSGSPVFTESKGKPVAVGLVYDCDLFLLKDRILAYPLNLAQSIDNLSKMK